MTASFKDNEILFALNRCVFTYIDIRNESQSLLVDDLVKEAIQKALDKFAEEIQRCMTDDSKSQDDNILYKLKHALDDLQSEIAKCLSNINTKWYKKLVNRRAGVSLEKFKNILEYEKSRDGFQTLGNLVGNDIDILIIGKNTKPSIREYAPTPAMA